MKRVRRPFRRLREGKLFQVETEYFAGHSSPTSLRRTRSCRRVEHYWLCDACSPYVTLTFDQERGVVTVPLPDGCGKKTVRVVTMDPANESAEERVLEQSMSEVQK